MPGEKATVFFRPWSVPESNNEDSEKITSDQQGIINTSIVKNEEDTDSVVSISTSGESTGTYSSEDENSMKDGTAKRLRRRSESSVDGSSESWSAHDESSTRNIKLKKLNNFAFNSPGACDFVMVPQTPERSSLSSSSFFLDTKGPSPSTDHSLDYLHMMALRQMHSFGPLNDSSRMMPMNLEPGMLHASMLATTGQPFTYEFPGTHHLSQEFYTPTMEQAVELVHRQDAAVKQMKKLRPKKFRCEHCDVAFSNNGQLKGHIRIHTGERPFKCDAEGCGKSFTRNEELTRHKRIHTGLRPHACIICGKRFGRKDHLKKHTRTHENRDPYRMPAAALGMFALTPSLPPTSSFHPYIYPM